MILIVQIIILMKIAQFANIILAKRFANCANYICTGHTLTLDCYITLL